MSKLITALLLAALPAAATAQLPELVPVDRVTMNEAVARALQTSPQVVQAETGLGTAEYSIKQAYASMLPTLSASSGASLSSSQRYSQDLGTTIPSQSQSYSAGLSTNLDLFAGGRNLAAVRSAQASAEAAEATLVTRRFAVVLAAKRAYLAVLRAEELIALNEQRIAQAQEQLSAAQRRLEAGRATRSDVLRAELQVRTAQNSLLNSQTQLRTSMYALGQQVGIAGPVAAERPATLDPAPLALAADRMREIVLAEAPSVVSAAANVEVAEAGYRSARAQYFPSLSARGGYNWNNQEFDVSDGRTSWNTSLSLSYPLFNGLSREVAVDRANAQVRVAEAQSADARRIALSEFERLLAALVLAEQQLALLEETVAVAEEDYRVQQTRYQADAATILELVSSQIALTQAQYDLINARYDYLIAKAELESLVGREL